MTLDNLRADVADLHKWGNPPSEIAKILGVHVEQVTNILIALGLVKRPTKRTQAHSMPRERINQIRKLDAEIQFYETRLSSLKQHRMTLAELERSSSNLQQSINRASR